MLTGMSKYTASNPIHFFFAILQQFFFHFFSCTSCDLCSLYLTLKVHYNYVFLNINTWCHNEVLHVLGEAE